MEQRDLGRHLQTKPNIILTSVEALEVRKVRKAMVAARDSLCVEPHKICVMIDEAQVSGQWSVGCLPPRGQSENKIRGVHIPPSHDPRNTILKGILIWSTGRPPPRLVFFSRSCDVKSGL